MKTLTFVAVVAALAMTSSAFAQTYAPRAEQYRAYAPQYTGGGSFGSNQLSHDNTQ